MGVGRSSLPRYAADSREVPHNSWSAALLKSGVQDHGIRFECSTEPSAMEAFEQSALIEKGGLIADMCVWLRVSDR